MEQTYTPKLDYKVLVRCFTYNQSKYIEDALNGFAMQKTNFPFACLVMDDCSTDGEQEVIKSWMERECDMEKAEYVDLELSKVILVPHKSNDNCTFAFYLLKQNLYGTGKKMPLVTPWREHCQYEAMCEGDDYWIIDDKLQKQVDALDNNQQVTMVYTDYQTVDESGTPFIRPQYEKYKELHMSGDNLPNLFKTNYPLTCTAMVRREVVKSDIYKNAPVKLDYALFMSAAFMGNFVYIDKQTSCYRQNPKSLMNAQHSLVEKCSKELGRYFSITYARGLSKIEPLFKDLLIKYHISKKYVSHIPEHKPIFKEICKYNKSFYWFVPIVWIVKTFEKITFQR